MMGTTGVPTALLSNYGMSGGGSSLDCATSEVSSEQIGKDLQTRAAQADPDGVQDIITSYSDKIDKKSLNAALRASVKGCNTALLDLAI